MPVFWYDWFIHHPVIGTIAVVLSMAWACVVVIIAYRYDQRN